jgi:hypothetical protein
MRNTVHDKLKAGRITRGVNASDASYGMAGAFEILGPNGVTLRIISAGHDGTGWEHVSVSLKNRAPNWREMCFVKDLFFEPHECVVQYHPAASEHINIHPHCLHLWRCTDQPFPMPPRLMV